MNKEQRVDYNYGLKKLKVAGQKVDHFAKVIDGFNYLTTRKAVVFSDITCKLYRELWGFDDEKAMVWMKNAYIYNRMKLKADEDRPLYFEDIENGKIIGVYAEGKAVVL